MALLLFRSSWTSYASNAQGTGKASYRLYMNFCHDVLVWNSIIMVGIWANSLSTFGTWRSGILFLTNFLWMADLLALWVVASTERKQWTILLKWQSIDSARKLKICLGKRKTLVPANACQPVNRTSKSAVNNGGFTGEVYRGGKCLRGRFTCDIANCHL